MKLKRVVEFTLSVILLLSLIAILSYFILTSTESIDLTTDPEIDGERNVTGVPEVDASNYSNVNGQDLEREIFDLVNDRRERHGRTPFVHSERVRLIARLHSADMAERNYFNHTNPEGLGPPERHEKHDGCDSPNENIAEWGTLPTNDTEEIAKVIVNDWSESPGHNTTQTSEYYHVSGVGIRVTAERELYVTQNFCREHPNA